MTRLRDGSTSLDPRVDRIAEFDEASRNFGVRTIIPTAATEPVTKMWDIPAGEPVLNQGAEGACVGFGVKIGRAHV